MIGKTGKMNIKPSYYYAGGLLAICVLFSLLYLRNGSPTSTSSTDVIFPHKKCGSAYYYCLEDHKCIDRKLVCDRKKDCSAGSDEDKCSNYPTDYWRDHNYLCNNGETTSFAFFCNDVSTVQKCEDNSDKDKCDFRGKNGTCSDGEFTCISDGRCIDGSWRKDGVSDCDDGSDEDLFVEMPKNLTDVIADCKETGGGEWIFRKGWSMAVNRDYFVCGDTRPFFCITNLGVCVSEPGWTCPDKINEQGCTTDQGTWTKFHCRNGHHAELTERCDGKPDCEDGSDEINCYKLDSYDHSFKIPYIL